MSLFPGYFTWSGLRMVQSATYFYVLRVSSDEFHILLRTIRNSTKNAEFESILRLNLASKLEFEKIRRSNLKVKRAKNSSAKFEVEFNLQNRISKYQMNLNEFVS